LAKVLSLPRNTKGRDFIVGDIHGAFSLLEKALEEADFDPEKDRVISVGDLIDRGPEPLRCLEFLKQPWFFAVRGNHEDMFLDMCSGGKLDREAAAGNIRNGMGWALSQPPEKLRELEAAFRALPVAIEIDTVRGTVGIVHAEVTAGLTWQDFTQKLREDDAATLETALWGRGRIKRGDESGVEGIGRVFLGHTPQAGAPTRLGNCYYIDTGAVFGLLRGDDDYFLTFADAAAKTTTFQAPHPAGKRVNVLKDVPKPRKPFGKHNRPGP
jgi:serine/threonine protein phosphatase 1